MRMKCRAIVAMLSISIFMFGGFAFGHSTDSPPVVAPARQILSAKTLLGKFPRSEDPAERSAKFASGTQWMKPTGGASPKKVHSPNGAFTVTFQTVKEDTGDFERHRAHVTWNDGKQQLLNEETVGWAEISPDSKYVAIEPLTLIDVKAWRSFDISKELGIPNYISIHYWSRDGKSIILSQADCAMDCPKDDAFSYWRVDLK